MTEPGDMKSAEMAALWRRFRALEAAAGTPKTAASDERAMLDLAAYADGRLDEAAAERVEAWLAAHPEALDDVGASRSIGDAVAPLQVIERAAALTSDDPAGAQIIPFRRPAARAYWRLHVARVAVAACLVLTGLIGFTLGSSVYSNLFPSSSGSVSGELFDQPSGFFSAEDSAI